MRKRADNLWDYLVSFRNLEQAAKRARLGKRSRDDVARFELELERELISLQRELEEGSYRPGPYRQFLIREPKSRLISCAPFRDRVVHHALCQVIEPHFERGFHPHSYACRVAKGTHAALDRFQALCRKHRWVLTCDVVKYFASIDHQILRQRLERRIADRRCRALLNQIIDGSPVPDEPVAYFRGDDLLTPLTRPRGLPIGNLTSQFFANVYLDAIDQFAARELRCSAYVRYCDDFVLFSDDRSRLLEWRAALSERLSALRLRLHPGKSVVRRTARGVRFLGFRVSPNCRRLARDSVVRFRRRSKRLQRAYARGETSFDEVASSVRGWLAHAAHGDTEALRRDLLEGLVFTQQSSKSEPFGEGS